MLRRRDCDWLGRSHAWINWGLYLRDFAQRLFR
jgi:hypothetical protein